MSKEVKIKRLLKEIVGTENYLIRGTVTKITGQTCNVKLNSGLEVSDVKLKALITDENDYYILFPVVGSGVMLLMENNDLRNLTVVKVDKVGKFEFLQSGLKVIFDSEDKKVKIENNEVNLLDAILELTGILKNNYRQYTANGPTNGALPASIQAIEQNENKFKKILK
ncbi:MAG: hypothetical protein AB7D46_00870 [Flavobacteriaceae bacterium]